MSEKDLDLLRWTARFSARFGFISRALFFGYFCTDSRANQFRKWRLLTDSGWFRDVSWAPLHLYLTKKGKLEVGAPFCTNRSPQYFEHDADVARLLLEIEGQSLAMRSWTELELRCSSWQATKALGSSIVIKLPDLVVDVRPDGARLAFEIERSLKSKERYARLALSVKSCSQIDAIAFGCGTPAILSSIRQSLASAGIGDKGLGFFMTSDFRTRGLECELSHRSGACRLIEFVRGGAGSETEMRPVSQDFESSKTRGTG